MKRDRISNVRLFRGDARFIVRDVLERGSLSGIYVNFPDPWPRKRHLEKRLLRAPFFELLSTRLADDGWLSFTTDHEEYFHFGLEEAESTGLYHIVRADPPAAALETKYAMKWREMEKPIFHATFHRLKAAGHSPPLIQRIEMHHAILDGDLSTVTGFEKVVRRFKGGTAIVLEGFRDLTNASLIFKVRVEETDLVQEILIQAYQKEDGVFVSLQPFGDPLSTRGVREAVHAVTDFLASTGLTVRQKWI